MNLQTFIPSFRLSTGSQQFAEQSNSTRNIVQTKANGAFPPQWESMTSKNVQAQSFELSSAKTANFFTPQNQSTNSKKGFAQALVQGRVDKTKYKTEMCKNWIEQGFCRYGGKCQFAHGGQDLVGKEQPPSTKYKTKMCKQFHEKQFCPYGNRCMFVHEQRKIEELANFFFVHKIQNAEESYACNSESQDSNLEFSPFESTPSRRLKIFSDICEDDESESKKGSQIDMASEASEETTCSSFCQSGRGSFRSFSPNSGFTSALNKDAASFNRNIASLRKFERSTMDFQSAI